jgi:hypothetical protein
MSRLVIGSTADYVVYYADKDGEDYDAIVTLKLTVKPLPAMGPTYSHGGLPPEPPGFDVVSDTLPPDLPNDLRDDCIEQAINQACENLSDFAWEPDA